MIMRRLMVMVAGLVFGVGMVGAAAPPEGIEPGAWAKVRPQLEARAERPGNAKDGRDGRDLVTKLLPQPDWTGVGSLFGYSVAVDGDTMVVGACYDDANGDSSGAAYVFGRNQGGADSWGLVAKLTGYEGDQYEEQFGWSVSISGNTAVVGAPLHDSYSHYDAGSAYVYERNEGGVGAWGLAHRLFGHDIWHGEEFGQSVSINGDTVVVGAHGYFYYGYASVFERDQGGTGEWGHVATLLAPDGDYHSYFGESVSIDGDTVVVGAPRTYIITNKSPNIIQSAGSVYIYSRNEGGADVWGFVAKLVASDADSFDYFGSSVSIDGDTLAVGAPYDEGGGSVYVLGRNHGGTDAWGEVAKLNGFDAEIYDHFGASVSISGNAIIVGADYDDDHGESSGSAYVFGQNQGGADAWGQVTKIVAADGASEDFFGKSVFISGDTVVVGSANDDDNGLDSGAAYVFERNQGGSDAWGQVAKQPAPSSLTAREDQFGFSVDTDGNIVVVGTPHDDGNGLDSGAVYIFERDQGGGDGWGQIAKLLASDGADDHWFGYSVAISGDTVVVGRKRDGNSGTIPSSAYVFDRNEGGTDAWGEVIKLDPLGGVGSTYFAASVSISGDTVVVGDFGAQFAHVYYRNEGGSNSWGQVVRLSDDGSDTDFGDAVAISGNTIVVGAYRDDDNGTFSGSAYVYDRSEGGIDAWGQVAKLMASDGEESDLFGSSVSVSGDTCIVGTPNRDGTRGVAFVFERNWGGADAWGELTKLSPPYSNTAKKFGDSVSISGDTVVVGAHAENSAYVFGRNNGGNDAWGQVEKLRASDLESYDYFGTSVSICGDTVVVGVPGDNDVGVDSGSVHIFGDFSFNPVVSLVTTTPDTGDGVLLPWEWTAVGITDFSVRFSESMADPDGDTDPTDITNAGNWLLAGAGPDGVAQTTSCDEGLAGDDLSVELDSFVYTAPQNTVAFRANGGSVLLEGAYTLFACGTLKGAGGYSLDGNGDGVGGDDFILPFGIDASAPSNPEVSSLSHTVGVPSSDRMIDFSWSGASDGLGSGLRGYSVVLGTTPETVPDEIVDVWHGDDPHVLTEGPVANGELWFFHLRTCDAVGLCSDPVHLGPFSIEGPFGVLKLGSEGSTLDGRVDQGEGVLVAMTQLVPSFSKAVSNPAGDGTQGDLTNPQHSRLIHHGTDGVLSTADCTSSVGGDDWEIPTVLPPLAWPGDGTASIVNFDSLGLGRGIYSLILCGLEDLEGEQLVVEPWFGHFIVNASNLLEDPNFDHGELSAWNIESPGGTDVFWEAVDPSTPHSGVAVIDPTSGGIGETFTLTQCIDVSTAAPYGLAGMVSVDSGMAADPTVTAKAEFFSEYGCVNLLETFERVFASGGSNLGWSPRMILGVRAPVGALSARVGFVVEGGTADQFSVSLDETAFFEDVLFVDGFEEGDASWWDNATP